MGFTAPVLKAGDARDPAGELNRLFCDRGRGDRVSSQARARIESKFSFDRRLSEPIDAVGRLTAERPRCHQKRQIV